MAIWLCVCLSTLALTASAASARDDQLDCKSLELGFASDGYSQICYAGEHELLAGSGDIYTERYEEIIAYGKAPQLRLSSHRSSLPVPPASVSVEGYVAARGWFTKTKEWQPEQELEGYRVRLFRGTWPGMGGFLHCAALLRQEPAAANAPFKRTVGGFFCFSAGGDYLISNLKPFLSSIQY